MNKQLHAKGINGAAGKWTANGFIPSHAQAKPVHATRSYRTYTVAIIILGMAYAAHSLILGSPVSELLGKAFWSIFGGS